MSKKLKVMSFSVEPDMEDEIKKYALEEGVSSSKLLRTLVEKYLLNKDKVTIVEHSDKYIAVVLKIPSQLRGDDRLKDWLKVKCEGIASKLAPSETEVSV
jgi:hypothetical protein